MKINIIGAGISGLSAGCYLQMNGFETEIFEKSGKPGGLCSSWQRGEYTFDGCIHWLLGSNASSPFFRLWSELIDMDSIAFINHETRMEIEVKENKDKYGDPVFRLYTHIDRLRNYLVDIAPEDTGMILKLVRSLKKIQTFEIPPMIDSVRKLLPAREKLKYIKHLPLLFFLLNWKKETNYSFARKLKNPFLKEGFQLLFDGEDLPLLIIIIPLAFYDKKGAGYPIGGSLRFAKKIEERYLSLGGKIRYNAEVKKIITENHTAKGLLLADDSIALSEITISAADWYFTHFKALGGNYVNKSILELKSQQKLQVYYSAFLVSLGLSRTFKDYPHFFRFPLKENLVSPDGTIYSRLETHIFNYDPTLAPTGKTVISVCFYTRKGDFWIDLRNSDHDGYDRFKKEFAQQIIDRLEEKLKGIKEFIEEIDIATPATYYRYTNNWKGSTQGWLPGKNIIAASPVEAELPGLSNFYFSGHWSIPGGGLPVAIKSARDVAQLICRQCKKTFSTR